MNGRAALQLPDVFVYVCLCMCVCVLMCLQFEENKGKRTDLVSFPPFFCFTLQVVKRKRAK